MIALERALLAVRSQSDAKAFLKVILTEEEVVDLRVRWACIQLMAAGHTQRQVQTKVSGKFRKKSKVGIATVIRAAKTVRAERRRVDQLLAACGEVAS